MPDIFNNLFSQIRWLDFVDIAVVAFVVYKILMFIQETRAVQLLKGIVVLLVATELSGLLKLYTVNYILKGTLTVGAIALIIVFQPELRRALQYIGRGKLFNRSFGEVDKEKVDRITENMMQAIRYFARNKIGALIILERDVAIGDIIETGTVLNAEISKELLINLFNTGAPLHDGAAVIRGEQIIAAGCVLPLTGNNNLSSDLGTRHRAGIGVTENSDAVALIVSVETGAMSVAMNGTLSRFMDANAMETVIRSVYLTNQPEGKAAGPVRPILEKLRGVGHGKG